MDSPALNANSRAVLAPLARPRLPTTITVAGPGPIEPQARNQLDDESPDASKEEPDVSLQETNLLVDATAADHSGAGAGTVEDDVVDGDDNDSNGPVADPYANLDGAFGGYLADQPQPMIGRRTDINDLDNL